MRMRCGCILCKYQDVLSIDTIYIEKFLRNILESVIYNALPECVRENQHF